MIFIVSLILTFGFALSALFIGFGPNVYRLSDKGFMARAFQNAELEAMHYGDLYLRAGILDPDDAAKNYTATRSRFTYNIIGSGTASAVTITSDITASRNSDGAQTISVTARK